MVSAISPNPLAEYWSLLAIDILIVTARLAARWKTFGWRNLAMDDFFMVVAMLFYTAETVAAHFVGAFWQGLANNAMTPEQRAALDPSSLEWHLRTEGSKTQLAGWLIYICVLWALKFCWLFFYRRLGEGVSHMAIKINLGFVFCVASFLATFGVVLLKCQPVSLNWQIYPDPGNWCQPAVSKIDAYIVILMNMTTDFYIMAIPVPMIWSARITKIRKLGLIAMFCGGLLTAVFGILRCIYVLLERPDSPELTGAWSVRESFVAVFISNLPVMYPIVRGFFANVSSKVYSSSRSKSQSKLDFGENQKSVGNTYKMSAFSRTSKKDKKFQHPLDLPNETYYTRFGSEEEIIGADGKRTTVVTANEEKMPNTLPMSNPFPQVTVTREFEVTDSFHLSDEDEKSLKSRS